MVSFTGIYGVYTKPVVILHCRSRQIAYAIIVGSGYASTVVKR